MSGIQKKTTHCPASACNRRRRHQASIQVPARNTENTGHCTCLIYSEFYHQAAQIPDCRYKTGHLATLATRVSWGGRDTLLRIFQFNQACTTYGSQCPYLSSPGITLSPLPLTPPLLPFPHCLHLASWHLSLLHPVPCWPAPPPLSTSPFPSFTWLLPSSLQGCLSLFESSGRWPWHHDATSLQHPGVCRCPALWLTPGLLMLELHAGSPAARITALPPPRQHSAPLPGWRIWWGRTTCSRHGPHRELLWATCCAGLY